MRRRTFKTVRPLRERSQGTLGSLAGSSLGDLDPGAGNPTDYLSIPSPPITEIPTTTPVNVCPSGQTRNQYGYCIPNTTSSPGFFDNLLSAFTKPAIPQYPYPYPGSMPSSGVSTTTLLVGGAALAAVLLIATRK